MAKNRDDFILQSAFCRICIWYYIPYIKVPSTQYLQEARNEAMPRYSSAKKMTTKRLMKQHKIECELHWCNMQPSWCLLQTPDKQLTHVQPWPLRIILLGSDMKASSEPGTLLQAMKPRRQIHSLFPYYTSLLNVPVTLEQYHMYGHEIEISMSLISKPCLKTTSIYKGCRHLPYLETRI